MMEGPDVIECFSSTQLSMKIILIANKYQGNQNQWKFQILNTKNLFLSSANHCWYFKYMSRVNFSLTCVEHEIYE